MSVDVRSQRPEPARAIPRSGLIDVPPFAVRRVLSSRRLGGRMRVRLQTELAFSLPGALRTARDWRALDAGFPLTPAIVWVESTANPVRTLGDITTSRNVTEIEIHADRCRCARCARVRKQRA